MGTEQTFIRLGKCERTSKSMQTDLKFRGSWGLKAKHNTPNRTPNGNPKSPISRLPNRLLQRD